MTADIAGSQYTICVTRKGSGCVASIAELCIAEAGTTPQDALASALRVEAEMRARIESEGGALPPPGGPADPAPGLARALGRQAVFARQVLIGYAIAAAVTVALLVLALPPARSRVEQYLAGKDAAADTGKLLSRLGIALCVQKP